MLELSFADTVALAVAAVVDVAVERVTSMALSTLAVAAVEIGYISAQLALLSKYSAVSVLLVLSLLIFV